MCKKKVVLIGLVLLVIIFPFIRGVNFQQLNDYIHEHEGYAVAIIMVFSIFRPFLFLPITLLCIVSGLTLEFHYSILVILFSMWISSTIIYFLSRQFSKQICGYIQKPKYIEILSKIRENEFSIILLARLSMVVHFDVLSVLAGIAGVSYKKYILATMIGFIPETLIYSSLHFGVEDTKVFVYIGIVFILFLIPVVYFRKKVF